MLLLLFTTVLGVAAPSADLAYAVRIRDLYLAQEAVDAGADPQAVLPQVLVACDGPMAEVLVGAGARPEGAEARRPLQCDEGLVRALAKGDATWAAALLVEAARDGRESLLRLLLEDGVEPSEAALEAALSRRHGAVADVLQAAGAPPSPRALAAAARDADLPRLADLTRGFDRTALGDALVACAGTHPDAVAWLLEQGAPVDHVSGQRGPALVEASAAGRGAIVAVLLQAGAAIDTPRFDGRTALMVSGRRPELMAQLLAAGADPLATLPTGWTVLHGAARQSSDSVALLLERGVPVDPALASSGETPLHQAARTGQAEVVRRLLDAGADPAARSAYVGGSARAVELAREAGHAEVVALLEAAEAPSAGGAP